MPLAVALGRLFCFSTPYAAKPEVPSIFLRPWIGNPRRVAARSRVVRGPGNGGVLVPGHEDDLLAADEVEPLPVEDLPVPEHPDGVRAGFQRSDDRAMAQVSDAIGDVVDHQ